MNIKKLILSILIASFAIRAIATEPLEKLPDIVIDTIYVSSESLIVAYEALRPFDHVSLTVQASWSMALKDAKPVILSGSIGKGKASIPVSLLLFHVFCFIHLFPAISFRRCRMRRLLCFIRAVRCPASADCRILCRCGIRVVSLMQPPVNR